MEVFGSPKIKNKEAL